MSFSSDDSLGDLPLPYDISSAVSRALRINSTDGSTSPDGCSKVVYPSNSLTAVDTTSHAIKTQVAMSPFNLASQPSTTSYAYENTLQPNFTPTGLHHYSSPGPPIYDQFGMEAVDAWNDHTVTVSICSSSESILDSQNDMEQLDQFCNYIVSNSDEELPLENSSSTSVAAPIYPSNSFPGPPYYYQYQVGLETPPRKKQRSTSNYREYQYPTSCSSTESSPEKCVSRLQAQNNCWTMKLENVSLWRQFDQIGTEMVITKGGRYIPGGHLITYFKV